MGQKIDKLDKELRIMPFYGADGYKTGHPEMMNPLVTREAFNFIPRSFKYMPNNIDKIMSSGSQITWRFIHAMFQENFFNAVELEYEKVWVESDTRPYFYNKPTGKILSNGKTAALKFAEDISKYIGTPYNFQGYSKLWDLGYLPVDIRALPEGVFTKKNIPHMTGISTTDEFAWLGLNLETLISKLSWQCPTAATIGFEFKYHAYKAAMETDPENIWFADFAAHDFHSRGGNPYTSIAVGLGHSFSNFGSDTLEVIPASRYYYDFSDIDVPIYSVNASEHSVTCTGIFFYKEQLEKGFLNEEIQHYYSFDVPCDGSVAEPDFLAIAEWLNLRDWLQKFPTGILSIVADTFNLWKLITYILPRLKEPIMLRAGKLVVRPDSGNPVDIVCGEVLAAYRNGLAGKDRKVWSNEEKGVVELLWDIFGGETTSTGYKRLDSHIGCIYGDSINLERQSDIYKRLKEKGFASTNVVLGVGSFTYVYMTRDQAGWAIKGCWFETKQYVSTDTCVTNSYDIFKDPITDEGTKTSLKGFSYIYYDENGEIECLNQVSEEQYNSPDNLLQRIYREGEFFNQTTLPAVRAKVQEHLIKRYNAETGSVR